MSEIRNVIKLTPTKALEIKERAATGDPNAGRLFVLYSAWKKIDAAKGYSTKAKLQVLTAFADEVKVAWPKTSS